MVQPFSQYPSSRYKRSWQLILALYYCGILLLWHITILFALQAVVLPDAEFPGLPTASPEHITEAPKWPIHRVRDKKQPPASSGWDAPATPSHIPAVHQNVTVTDHNYSGWDAEGANDWGGAEAGGKWGASAEVEQEYDGGWGGEQTNGYQQSAHEQGARDDYTAAHTPGMLLCPVAD